MRNASYTNELLNGTRDYFKNLGLHFTAPDQQVRIISGNEEGLSGWISTNILVGELYKNNKPFETYGVSDMGGMFVCIKHRSDRLSKHRCKYTNEFCFSKCYK